jgi:hypothetical protein
MAVKDRVFFILQKNRPAKKENGRFPFLLPFGKEKFVGFARMPRLFCCANGQNRIQ